MGRSGRRHGGEPGADRRRVCTRRGKVYLVDLCDSLLAVARKRCEARGWKNVEAVSADATTFRPAGGPADVVTFSYSLTMIPDWFAAIDNALAMLRPGGTIGVTDFFVARKYPAEGRARHSWFTRTFWPAWFGSDNVFLSPDHIPYLQRNFRTLPSWKERAKLPRLPLIRVPYYTFVGGGRNSSAAGPQSRTECLLQNKPKKTNDLLLDVAPRAGK